MATHYHDERASKDPDKDPGSDTIITTHSKVPISVVISMITLAIMGTGYFLSIKSDLAEMKRHMASDWMLQEQRVWASQVSKLNPSVQVPDADLIWAMTHRSAINP